MESTIERFEAKLQRGADYDEVEAYIEAQDHLSRDQKDVLWLAWADSDAPLPHEDRSAGGRRRSRRVDHSTALPSRSCV